MMSPGIWLYGIFLLLLICGVPIAVCLGLSGILIIITSSLGIQVLPTIVFASIAKPSLVAIPFFILAGVIFYRIGIAERLIHLVKLIVGPIPGGLAIVTVLSALILGANTGSGPAETAALGSVVNLYVACKIADLSIEDVAWEAFRFAFAAFLGLLIVLYVPILATWLPSLM